MRNFMKWYKIIINVNLNFNEYCKKLMKKFKIQRILQHKSKEKVLLKAKDKQKNVMKIYAI